ncbi:MULTISPECIES: 4-(cytidine 5'-diphospho)-2-C-methyl-D-erythritol kinase [Calditerrivibrio]|uniref:4-diphosphocytidyl-2-C-methyl-D-erythritol kinase n=1 Tax=Calditerrivibrio nitroreducens TaxID=477976 RepID=A0A2J6WRQ2_9BACT|nr:MAG: 4-(cytidine 5'-diphospho)-2-C-methyl-D-erythritol kinase [Calditerrivibrio nitroreducens]
MDFIRSYAKINIFLHIINKRSDGYHDIFSLMAKIGLYDTVFVEKSDRFEIDSNVRWLPTDENNIVYKVYQKVKEIYDIPPVRFKIFKNIPAGAGLGGGSSNAEAGLTLLDVYFGLNMGYQEKMDVLKSVGSDTAFFLVKDGVAYAEGRGEIVSKGPLLPKAKILLVKPPFSVSTKEAYAGVKLRLTNNYNEDKIKSFVGYGDMIKMQENDFEYTIFEKYPELSWIKNMLIKFGADGALMSGSGSTVYGVFSNENKMNEAERFFRKLNIYWTLKTTIL